ncbi:PilN domain-containing protein [Metallumcola ferriviriculae]|uniref:PilN domain-containing protein n=1 Tax=Metallumcola ferriviriculae TaxID=3039180 RepID=A0AAU0US33_9FIRM|nr:PilN domain-containing protein [Desulfitibacteraceae bacterium MK1]
MAQINLLPIELRPKSPLNNPKVISAVLVGLLVIIAVTLVGGWFWYMNSLEQQLSQVQSQRKQLTTTLAKVDKLEKDIDNRQAEITQLQQITTNRLRWAQMLEDVEDNFPQKVWLQSLSTGDGGMLVIEGQSVALEDVGVLIHQLNDLSYFSTVVLNQMDQADEYPHAVTFKVTARLAK